MGMKILFLVLILGMVLVSGCSANTIEGSCLNACQESNNCDYLNFKCMDDEQCAEQFKQCQITCWNVCYSDVINKSKPK